jgi:beta-phosphoglucomutase
MPSLNPVYPNSKKIAAIRNDLRLGQEELAELIKLPLRTIQKLEGLRQVQYDTVKLFANRITQTEVFKKRGILVTPDDLVLELREPNGDSGESKGLTAIPASTVYDFIQKYNLFAKSKRVDLYLYTGETIPTSVKDQLYSLPDEIQFRLLVRHPCEGRTREHKLQQSIGSFTSVMHRNRKVMFNIRFYDTSPILRAFLFHSRGNGNSQGLVGLYKWKHGFSPEYDYVGSEDNSLLQVSDEAKPQKDIFEGFQSRFNETWHNLTKPRAVIFDLDGLLIDSMGFYLEAYQSTLKPYGILMERDFVYLHEGEKMENTIKQAFRKAGKQPPNDKAVQKILDNVKRKHQLLFRVQFLPGALELLDLLAKRGVKLALVTGSRTLSENFRGNATFLKRFSVIIDGNATMQGKPSPQPYELAVKKLALQKEDCCVIENAPLGIQSAVSANLDCFAVTGPSTLPPATLKDEGAVATFPNLNSLKNLLTFADVNMPMRAFYGYFKDHLGATSSD